SVGVASHANASDIDALLARADAALYAAKANGRNRVEAEAPQADAPQADAPQADAPQAAATAPAEAAIAPAEQEPEAAASGNTVDWSSYRRPNWAPAERQVAA